jgi:co-chaperonin GroES (HSP10)
MASVIIPRAGYALLRRVATPEQRSAAGIVLAGQAADAELVEFEVLRVGSAKDGSFSSLVQGMTVIASRFHGQAVRLCGEELVLMKQKCIVAVMGDDELG